MPARLPGIEVSLVTRELVSVAYRLDVSEKEWLEGLSDVLGRMCAGEANIAQFSGAELKAASGNDAFFNSLSFELLGPGEVGCNCIDPAKEMRRWLCWLASGHERLVYVCSIPPTGTCPNWAAMSHVLKPALGIRTALSGFTGSTHSVDLRPALNKAILDTEVVAEMLESPLPPLVRSVWEGVLTGTWSLIDVQTAQHGWNVVAHRNAEGHIDPRALSAREQDVLRLTAIGLSNKEIGYRMGISASSVASFLRRAMEKMHIVSRVQLVAIAGVLGVPDIQSHEEIQPKTEVAQIAEELDQMLSSLSTGEAEKSEVIELRKRLKRLTEITK